MNNGQDMTTTNALPDVNDKLFAQFNKDFRSNAVLSSGMNKFFLYSEGYERAAKKLYEGIHGESFDINFSVYPLIFLNRQYLELRLKELISGFNYVVSQEYVFPNGHGLKALWDKFKALLLQQAPNYRPDNVTIANVEQLILEFDTIDPKSFAFRYPVDTSPQRNCSLTITNIDIENFMLTMQKLYNFFGQTSDVMYNLVDLTDEFISNMRAEWESEMHSYYGY